MILASADYVAARAWMSSPWNASMALLLVGSTFYHARLGVQVVIEDYVHHRAAEVSLQVLVAAAALVGAIVSAVAILKVAFVG